jgi:hypothetical protein
MADALRCGYLNLAVPGSSNERIVRTTVEWLGRRGENEAGDEVLVVVMWTVTGGFEYFAERGREWRSLNPGVEASAWYEGLGLAERRYFECHQRLRCGEHETATRHWVAVLLLQSYLAGAGVPYLFCNAFRPLPTGVAYAAFRDQLDVRRFHGPFEPESTYWQASLDSGFTPGPDGHLPEAAHRAWATTLVEALEERAS